MTASTTTSIGSAEVPRGVPSSVSDPLGDRLARGAHVTVDRIVDGASATVDRVQSGVTEALSSVGDKVHGLSASQQQQWVDHCRQSVRDHPLAAVCAGLAAGWLIARWLRA